MPAIGAKRILTIEDDTVTLRALAQMVQNAGYLEVITKDGAEAKKFLNRTSRLNAGGDQFCG